MFARKARKVIPVWWLVVVAAVLHLFSSQKHMIPSFPPSVMQTWSTMNRLISISSVQVRLTDS